MTNHKNLLAVTVFLILVLAAWMSYFLLPQPQVAALPETEQGYSLMGYDFTDTVYTGAESWESWPERFYFPADFESGGVSDAPVTLSSDDYRTIQYATHRLTLTLPAGEQYALFVRSSDYAMRLYIDGEEIGSVGIPGESRESTLPRVLEKTYTFTPKAETVTLVVHTSNFVHGKAGCQPPVFVIGTPENVGKLNTAKTAFSFAITGCLMTAALYHMGLFLLNRKRKNALYLSACCVIFFIMTKIPVFTFLPEYTFSFWIRVEYLTHICAFLMLTLFLKSLFPRLYNKWVLRVFHGIIGLYALIILLTDSVFFTRLLLYFEVLAVLIILYSVVGLALSLRGGGMKHLLGFLGVLAISATGLSDIIFYRGVEIGHRFLGQYFVTPLGMVFFIFCYALVVSLEYAETERAMRSALEAERKLAAENAMLDSLSQMKSDYLANISHEMRTPLTVMSGYAQQTEEEIEAGEVDAQSVKNLRIIQAEARRLAELAGNVLYSSKNLQTGIAITATKPLDILERAAAVCAPILAKNGNRLETDCAPDCPNAKANLDMIVQVLVNLCSNAGRHTKNGLVSISAKGAGDFVEFSVRDSGSGIAPGLLPHVFGRGVSGDDATGLGLAICKDVIAQHGGEINIDSEVGKGTTITFTLPLSATEVRV